MIKTFFLSIHFSVLISLLIDLNWINESNETEINHRKWIDKKNVLMIIKLKLKSSFCRFTFFDKMIILINWMIIWINKERIKRRKKKEMKKEPKERRKKQRKKEEKTNANAIDLDHHISHFQIFERWTQNPKTPASWKKRKCDFSKMKSFWKWMFLRLQRNEN